VLIGGRCKGQNGVVRHFSSLHFVLHSTLLGHRLTAISIWWRRDTVVWLASSSAGRCLWLLYDYRDDCLTYGLSSSRLTLIEYMPISQTSDIATIPPPEVLPKCETQDSSAPRHFGTSAEMSETLWRQITGRIGLCLGSKASVYNYRPYRSHLPIKCISGEPTDAGVVSGLVMFKNTARRR